jgi:integrase/recombinase XerD
VLKLRLGDLQDRKLILREPKSGKEYEFVFIPQKVADRLREYALKVCNAISKVILRHANLSTTQRYLGTISDVEAIRWIENIYR